MPGPMRKRSSDTKEVAALKRRIAELEAIEKRKNAMIERKNKKIERQVEEKEELKEEIKKLKEAVVDEEQKNEELERAHADAQRRSATKLEETKKELRESWETTLMLTRKSAGAMQEVVDLLEDQERIQNEINDIVEALEGVKESRQQLSARLGNLPWST